MEAELNSWVVCDPQNEIDTLPQPYSLIEEVFQQTVLLQLAIRLHEIEQSKKDVNYQGNLKKFFASSTLPHQNICCVSAQPHQQNHILFGDKTGSIYLYDIPKRMQFAKLQLQQTAPIRHIAHCSLPFKPQPLFLAAVILPTSLHIVGFRSSDPKLHFVNKVDSVSLQQSALYDYGRILIVFTKEKFIQCYALSQGDFTKEGSKINIVKKIQIKFQGVKNKLKFNQIVKKLKNKQTNINYTQNKKEQTTIQNKYEPYFKLVHCETQMCRKKYFGSGVIVKKIQKTIHGWYNTKEIHISTLNSNNQYPPQYMLNEQTKQMNVENKAKKQFGSPNELTMSLITTLNTLYPITCLNLSPNEGKLCVGLMDGTLQLIDTSSLCLERSLQRHPSPVRCISFFEEWKIVSGSDSHLHIDNLFTATKELKVKADKITNIQVQSKGIAVTTDQSSKLRVYDLWRSRKICRVECCGVYNQGSKLWKGNTLYCNGEYIVCLSQDYSNKNSNIDNNSLNHNANDNSNVQNNSDSNKDSATAIHIVRIFDLLLHLFVGLQTTFKKGYQRIEVQNIFSNVEYAQLHDRHLDIPQFHSIDPKTKNSKPINQLLSIAQIGQTASKQSSAKNQSMSNRSESLNTNNHSINNQSISNQNQSINNINKPNQNNIIGNTQHHSSKRGSPNKNRKLTNEALHPQKFLLKRREIKNDEVVTEQSLIKKIKQEHKKKDRRNNILQQEINKNIG